MDIHNYKGNFDRTVERVKEAVDISDENKGVILKFRDYCLSEGLGYAKIIRYLVDLMKYARMLKKPFSDASKDDIRRVVGELEQTNLSAETKKCFKLMLRKLYRFIEGIEEKGVYSERVKWISIHISSNHGKMPEELLTEEEMKKIIQKCITLRDKALCSALCESGCRISEIGTMQIKHISFEEYGARLTVNGKTGMRKILVIGSAPYLQEWLNRHPDNENPEAQLWIASNGKSLSYARISDIIKRAAVRAGITKRVYCHLFRHSRATILANKMSDSALKDYLGWTQGSKMAGIYIHMSGKETDEVILQMNGIEIDKEKTLSVLQPKKCLKCSTVNEVTNRFCKLCGLPLEKEEAEKILKADIEKEEVNKIMSELVKNKDALKLLVEAIRNKGLL